MQEVYWIPRKRTRSQLETIVAMFIPGDYTRAERNVKGFLKYDEGVIGSLFYNAVYYN